MPVRQQAIGPSRLLAGRLVVLVVAWESVQKQAFVWEEQIRFV